MCRTSGTQTSIGWAQSVLTPYIDATRGDSPATATPRCQSGITPFLFVQNLKHFEAYLSWYIFVAQ
jgi:hypothetical protein